MREVTGLALTCYTFKFRPVVFTLRAEVAELADAQASGACSAREWRFKSSLPHQNAHVAVCSLWTNPEGAELRLTVDGKVQLTDVSHHLFALPIVALAWRERYHWIKGWR